MYSRVVNTSDCNFCIFDVVCYRLKMFMDNTAVTWIRDKDD